ncbi:MAG TPA: aminoglycoside phosphotransferase family protein [Gaiellales bacterium]|nr:aminoglycoside phosphotransferase family protein [Gaiellales bacterium]
MTGDARRAAEVARAFGLGAEARFTGRVERGEQGRVEELLTARGAFAVKTSFGEPDLDGEDAAFQAAARAEGVPAPEVVRAAAGDWHADIGGLPVRVYEWVDLLPVDRGIDPAETGRVVAAIHRTPFAGSRPEDPWYTDPVGAAAWDGLVGDLAAARAPFASGVAGLRADLVALEAQLAPAARLRTCHRDLWAENMRRTTSGGLCVIDWENCGLADPGQEVAGVVFELGIRDRARGGEVYRSYREAGGPGTVRTRADFSMTIAQLGHILEIACRIWLDPETTETERRHQEARVAEFVDDPLTVAVVDELLEAVGDVA